MYARVEEEDEDVGEWHRAAGALYHSESKMARGEDGPHALRSESVKRTINSTKHKLMKSSFYGSVSLCRFLTNVCIKLSKDLGSAMKCFLTCSVADVYSYMR